MYALSVLAIERRTLMGIGRPIPVLTLTDEERDALGRWARRPTTAQALAQRARLVLACACGRTNTQVARQLRLTKQTVGKWRSRFVAARLDGLLDERARARSAASGAPSACSRIGPRPSS